jgi:hypothetical protein
LEIKRVRGQNSAEYGHFQSYERIQSPELAAWIRGGAFTAVCLAYCRSRRGVNFAKGKLGNFSVY